jgi:cytochrome P450
VTVFSMIGFPEGDIPQLKAWCEDKLEVNWGRPSAEYQRRAAENMSKFFAYCEEFVELRRATPADDMTSDLLRDRETSSDPLDDKEVASVLFALSFAGHETTTNLISNTVRQVLSRPELWERLRLDRTIIPAVVEETLRFDSSVIAWRRVTTREVEVGGVRLPAGAKLILSLASANHDPRRFPEPETFEIGRPNARTHLSFGKGIHFCLGQNLARIEAEVVLSILADRFPDLRLARQEFTFPPNISFRGPHELHVAWEVR